MPSSNPQARSADAARKNLLARRASVLKLQDHNETDSQALRSDEKDSREQALTEEIADVLVRLSERERGVVLEIDEALARLAAGTWGVCEVCKAPIGKPRLKAMPEARRCLTCAA